MQARRLRNALLARITNAAGVESCAPTGSILKAFEFSLNMTPRGLEHN